MSKETRPSHSSCKVGLYHLMVKVYRQNKHHLLQHLQQYQRGFLKLFRWAIKATPIVALVVQELPVAIEIIAEIITAEGKKKVGLIN